MKYTISSPFVLFSFLFLFLSFNAWSQNTISVIPHTGTGACRDNLYRIIISNSGSGPDTISITGAITDSLTSNCALTSQGIDFRVDTVGTVINQGDTLEFTIGAGVTDTLFYHAYIDCHVIPKTQSSPTINFEQQFTSNGAITGLGVGNIHNTPNITYPLVIELNKTQNMNGFYLTESDFVFRYTNTKVAAARMRFFFNHDTSNYCHQLTTNSVEFQIGINGNQVLHNNIQGDTITLNQNDTLYIRQQVTVNNCLNSCTLDSAIFRWECNYPSVVTSNFCPSCQDEYIHPYHVNKDPLPTVDVIRVEPIDINYDNACMNDTAGMTFWSYKIINTGNEAIDTLAFHLMQRINSFNTVQDDNLRYLALLPISSLSMSRNGTAGGINADTIARVHYLCTDLIPDALHRLNVTVTDFLTTDTLYISFKTFRCSSDDPALFNVVKNYNQWGFDSLEVVNKCGNSRLIETTQGLMPNSNYLSGQSGYDVDLKTTFMPTVSDLTYTASIAEKAQFHVDLKTLLNKGKPRVYQLLGCNQPNADCDTLFGWLRAKVSVKTNLILAQPSTEAFLRKITVTTGDTVMKANNWWHSVSDTTACMDRDYYYYFNLNDSAMRSYLDSGQFVFTLTACCASDTSPTPYFVEFHLLAEPDTNCLTTAIPSGHDMPLTITDPKQKWLALSTEDNDISVHCPGCLAPGIIVDHYQMNRTSLGLQDSDDDGRADSATAVIDPSSAWYQNNKEKLKLDFSAYNDRIEDLLIAHLERGDPSNGGYSYANMQASPLNLRFNALQVSRRIPLGLQTMLLTPDTVEFYIDHPQDSTGGCFECEPFGIGANDFTTQLKITVTGTDIFTHFLDTIINNNEYLFKFVDTLGGNLNNPSFITPLSTSKPFNGFFEEQYYRMRVTYRVCGNFTGNDFDLETHVKESRIRNKMWVSGKVQTTSSIPQMLNDLDTLHAIGLTVFPTDSAYALIDTSYINNHLFYCETKGSIHYFVSSDRKNASTIINSPGCEKTMTAIAITKTAGGKAMFDAYPFEYRPPLLGADSIIVQVPTGYFLSSASLKNRIVFNSYDYNSDTIGIPLADTLTGTVVFALSDLPPLNCFTQADTPSALNQTMWYGDQLNTRFIDMKLMPLTCNTPPISCPDTTIKIRFDQENVPCMTTAGCALEGALPLKIQVYNPVTLFIDPGLDRTDTATTVLAVKDTVCWDIAMDNFSGLSQADHVFIAILPDGVQNFLTGWHFYPTDSTVANYLNDAIVPITIALGHDSIITGKLCAVVNVCDTVNTIPINIHYGWNCGQWPTLPYDSTAVCGYNLDSLAVNFATVSLASDSGKSYEIPYVLCDTIPVRTCFRNSNQGYVYPYEVLLSNIQNGVTVVSGFMQSSLFSFPLIGTPGDSLWAISDSGLSVLYPQNGGFTNVDGEFCLTLNLSLDCAFAGNTILPDKELFATTFCGDTISAFVNYTVRPEFVMDTTTSNCDACFTLEKFAIDTVAYTGTPITYYLAACNLSADTNIVNITDLIPPGFIPTSPITFVDTLQSMECDTFAVTGTFSSGDTCPNTTNTALLIHAGDTISDSWCVPVISTVDLCIAQADTVWTGVLYSTSLPKTFSNDTIFIADSLIVNDTLEFFNSRLIIGGGGSITVVDSGYFYVASTIVEACDTMWRGITANLGSKVMITEQSTVRDANVAVLAKNKSVITIIDSKLLSNARNVVIPVMSGISTISVILTMYGDTIAMDSSAFLPNYIGQPSHGSLPASGVETNNWIGTIGSSGDIQKNVFNDLITGIIGSRSRIVLENNEFGRIKLDTSSVGNATYKGIAVFVASDTSQGPSRVTIGSDNYFYSCKYGTYTSNCITTISGVVMDTMTYGVHVRNCIAGSTTRVENCTINASYRGIDMLNNAGASEMAIVGNTVTVTNDASATAAIRMQEATFGEAFYKIYNNNVTTIGARDGILAVAVYGAGIRNNRITQQPLSAINSNRGIALNGCDSVTVSCNELVSTYTISSGNVATGIGVSESSSSSILCNTVDEHNRGIFFGGICGATNFSGNRMGRHYVGLYLNTAAAIDQQYYNGNIWDDTTKYSSGFGAVNMNDSSSLNLTASLFTTDQTVVSHNPKIPFVSSPPFYVINSGWFDPQTGTSSFLCSTSRVCADTVIGGGEALRMMIAGGDVLTSEFIPESQMIASQYLYDVLKEDSSLLSNSIYQIFLQDKEFESVGYLHQVKKALKSSGRLDENLKTTIMDANAIIAMYSDSLHYLDSLAVLNPNNNYSSQWEMYVEQIDDQKIIIENALQVLRVQDSTLLSQAETANNLVTPTELPDENEKFINTITTLFLKDGVNAIISYYNQILTIANQCPFEGGIPVYRARVFVSLLNDSIGYDDESVCELQGIYRQSIQVSKDVIANAITIRPNPTSDYAEIILGDFYEGICNIEIKDLTGRIIYSGSFDCKEKSKKVDVSSLSGGIYTVTIFIGDQFVKSSKLSIVQ